MPLVSEQLPNLMNGVSQQAAAMRMHSQAERQVNGMSSLVEGVNKRLPLEFISKLINGDAGNIFIHHISRDQDEQYIVVVADGSIRVFDLGGTEYSVDTPDGVAYITGITPDEDIRAVTLADNTFILNTKKVVATDDTYTSPSTPGEAMAFIRAVNYDTTYKVLVDGVEKASYTTVDAYSTNPKVAIADVTAALKTELETNLGAGWTVTDYSPVVHIEKDNGTSFELEVTDTNGNTMSRAINGKVQRFTDLPVVGNHGMIVQVTGDPGSENDDYFIKFEANKGSGFDSGVWVETTAPGIKTKFNNLTMPHKLIRLGNGNFRFKPVTWGFRDCGSEESNPWPSFLGKTVRDMFYDRNRMCFLSDDDVIMSRARDLFSFFRETMTSLLDTDPIDIPAAGREVALLEYAVPFSKQIVIFSGQKQFMIDAEKLVASDPPGVKEITAFEIDTRAKPIAVGKTVFFAVRSGRFSRMMEYFIVPESETTDAADVTKHVPKYIPKGLFKVAASPTDDILLALNETEPNKVHVYKFYWQGNQKMQSSWSYWEFRSDAEVLSAEFVGDVVYFVVQYPDGLYLEKMSVAEGTAGEGAEEFVPRLDRLLNESQLTSVTYSSGTNTTTLTLPYNADGAGVQVVTRPGTLPTGFSPYQAVQQQSATSNTVTLVGDWRNASLYVGEKYEFLYEFTKPALKTQGPSGGSAALLAGRLQINRWLVAYDNTGYFKATVQTANGGTFTYTFTGKILGTSGAILGDYSLSEGEFGFRVNTDAKAVKVTLTNDSFLPSYFTSAEWEGRFERRTSRA